MTNSTGMSRRYSARISMVVVAILVSSLSLSGCGLFGKSKPDDTPVPIDKFSDTASDNNVPLKLYAGKNINLDANGQPLSLLVKLYVIKDVNAFEQADFDTFLTPGAVQDALGSDLVKERETMLVPGQKYTTHVPKMPDGGYLGVVALFRNPSPQRWRMAFKLDPKQAKPITIGLNACAMSMTQGAIVNREHASLSRLTNATCPNQALDNDDDSADE